MSTCTKDQYLFIKESTTLKALSHDQILLCDGYVRTRILNDLSESISPIMTNDVVILCNAFVLLDVKSLLEHEYAELSNQEGNDWMMNKDDLYEAEIVTLESMSEVLIDNCEYWIAYKSWNIYISICDNATRKSSGYSWLGYILCRWTKQAETAIEHHLKAIELCPKSSDAQFYYGITLAQNGQYKQALQAFIESSTDTMHLWERLTSKSIHAEFGHNHDILEGLFISAVDHYPNDTLFRYHLAIFYATRNKPNYKKSVIQFKKAINLDPNVPIQLDKAYYANAHGHACEYAFDYENARKYYIMAMEIGGDDELGNKYIYDCAIFLKDKMKEYEKASILLSQLVEKYPAHYPYLQQYGDCYLFMNDMDKGLKFYEAAIELYPFEVDAVYYRFGLIGGERAKRLYEKAIALDPMDARIYWAYAIMLRDHVGDFKKSEEYYLKAIELDKKMGEYCYGFLCYLRGKYDLALQYVEKGLRYNPDNFLFYYYAAFIYEACGNNDSAERAFWKGIILSDGHEGLVLDHLRARDTVRGLNIETHTRFKHIIGSVMLSRANTNCVLI